MLNCLCVRQIVVFFMIKVRIVLFSCIFRRLHLLIFMIDVSASVKNTGSLIKMVIALKNR